MVTDADAIVATSAGVADDLAGAFGVPAGHIHVIHNPIDLDAIVAAAAEADRWSMHRRGSTPLIVAAGRLADAKNYPLLIEAFALLRARMPVQLIILGPEISKRRCARWSPRSIWNAS